MSENKNKDSVTNLIQNFEKLRDLKRTENIKDKLSEVEFQELELLHYRVGQILEALGVTLNVIDTFDKKVETFLGKISHKNPGI